MVHWFWIKAGEVLLGGVLALADYLSLHVLLCLIPAFFIAGAMIVFVPKDLETEAPLEDIFEKYSAGNRYGRFTIGDFTRPTKESATIFFQDVACLSGGGAELEYKVKEDDSVEYYRQGMIFLS